MTNIAGLLALVQFGPHLFGDGDVGHYAVAMNAQP
jgi:hypothetical protein